ncbi:MAG: hypothetical protein HC898_13040 [Phycisphaerales bacterium]|nr:hypothetical protein [Phycisphaerales bacterium]
MYQRLVQVRDYDTPSSTTITKQLDYLYDSNNRLVSRTLDSNGPTTAGGLSSQLYLWDRMSDKVVMTLADGDGASASARSIRTASATNQPSSLSAINAPGPAPEVSPNFRIATFTPPAPSVRPWLAITMNPPPARSPAM